MEKFPQIIHDGITKGHIRLEDDEKFIVYGYQNKRRNFQNPEEKVQAETFLRLIFDYNYPVRRIRQFVPVTMGSNTKEADIVVYSDDERTAPHILVECKSPDVSEAEFKQAHLQGFSYAVPQGAPYVWTTSGIKNEYFERDLKKPQLQTSVSDIPQFGVKGLAAFKYAYKGAQRPTDRSSFRCKKSKKTN